LKKIYLDYNATTPVLPEIFEAMKPYFISKWGNPSSVHWAGESINQDIETARKNIAKSLNCNADEIYFTSCGTESNNWVIKMSALTSGKKTGHIITTKVEHPAVLETCKFLEKHGIKVTYLNVDSNGNLDIEEFENSINENTVLISIMTANNETGVIFPIKELSEIAQKYNIPFHTDAVQAYGKENMDLSNLKVDFLSISGHKVYCPKGIGILFIRKHSILEPMIHGGGQERGLRSGTENVPYIVGLGKAAEIIIENFKNQNYKNIKKLRDDFEKTLFENLENISINGDINNRLVNTSNICFKTIETSALIKALSIEGIAVSAGSACASHKESYSHVLKAMGKTKLEALSSIRVSVGDYSKNEDVMFAAERIIYWVKKLRNFSPEKI
jgi:cysteine desulfurase